MTGQTETAKECIIQKCVIQRGRTDRTDVNRQYRRKYICGRKNGIDQRIRKYMGVELFRPAADTGRSGVEGGVTASTLFAAFFRLQ